MPFSDRSFFSTLAEHTLQAMPITGIVLFIFVFLNALDTYSVSTNAHKLFAVQKYKNNS